MSRVSVVVPVLDELDNCVELTRQLLALFDALSHELEIVFVDDGSAPPTAMLLDELADRHGAVGVVHLSRNFGHQAAMSAGLAAATGDAVITMDGDLQHPVTVLPRLLSAWEEGGEVVHACRQADEVTSLTKRSTASAYYATIRALSATNIPTNCADFRLLDRVAVDALNALPERVRFLRGLAVWIGFEQRTITYEVHARRSGESKYHLRRMLSLAMDGIASFSAIPLQLALVVGALCTLAAVAYLAWVVFAFYAYGLAIPGWSSLMVVMLFLGGVQSTLLGVVGLYVGKVYEETKSRPLYIVRSQVGLHPTRSRNHR